MNKVQPIYETTEDHPPIWGGRYYVSAELEEFSGYKNVVWEIFQVDMDRDEISKLLSEFGFNIEDPYFDSQVEDTFTIEQAEQVKKFLESEGVKVRITPAYIPRKNGIGCSVIPVGGGTDNYMLDRMDDYPLDFRVWAHYRLDHCEPTDDALYQGLMNVILRKASDRPEVLERISKKLMGASFVPMEPGSYVYDDNPF